MALTLEQARKQRSDLVKQAASEFSKIIDGEIINNLGRLESGETFISNYNFQDEDSVAFLETAEIRDEAFLQLELIYKLNGWKLLINKNQ